MPKGYEDTYTGKTIHHCATCATWKVVRPATFGSCEVERARRTKGVFTAKLGLMPWSACCNKWRGKKREVDLAL